MKYAENPIQKDIWEHASEYDMKAAEVAVLINIARNTDFRTRECFKTVTRIAKETQYSYREVQYIMRKLEEKELLFVYTCKQRGKPHLMLVVPLEIGLRSEFLLYPAIKNTRGVIYQYRDPQLQLEKTKKGLGIIAQTSKAQ